jgi:aspartate-semialdehyde dehydrogenase
LAEKGARVIDLTSAFRLDPRVPLLAEPPAAALPRLVSLPGGAPLAAYRALRPLAAGPGLASLDATLLLPVSGAGAAGVRELSRQSAALLGGGRAKPRHFAHRIAFNLLPGSPEPEGLESRGERLFRAELRRLLAQPALPIAVSSARVPVFFGLSLSLTCTSERSGKLAEVEALYRSVPRGELKVLAGTGVEAMPSIAAGDSSVLVGRLRGEDSRWQLWACVDQLRMRAQLAVDLARSLL